jgi:hypothetical protein
MVARLAAFSVAVAAALVVAASSQSSQLVARDARNLQLAVNWRGEALLTYTRGGFGFDRHVLLWGATGTRGQLQVDYTGGKERYHFAYWRQFSATCGRYDGPRLAYFVAACKAPDGTYWAVQSLPQPGSTHTWLEVSHWRGEVAKVAAGMAWAYDGRFQLIYGRVTYEGEAAAGALVHLDTFNSSFGPRWQRENDFAAHLHSGAFCYGLYPHKSKDGALFAGTGQKYRLAVSGPGATPIVLANVPGSHDFDPLSAGDARMEQRAAARLRSWGVPNTDRDCGPVLRMAAKLAARATPRSA